jgi:hypothetical protein
MTASHPLQTILRSTLFIVPAYGMDGDDRFRPKPDLLPGHQPVDGTSADLLARQFLYGSNRSCRRLADANVETQCACALRSWNFRHGSGGS